MPIVYVIPLVDNLYISASTGDEESDGVEEEYDSDSDHSIDEDNIEESELSY